MEQIIEGKIRCLHKSWWGTTINLNFNADPVIDLWFNDRVCRLNAGPHNYNRKKNNEGAGVVDLDSLTISDLEDSEEDTFP